jgi:excisionase family DNA binding protein
MTTQTNEKIYTLTTEQAGKLLDYHPQYIRDLTRLRKLPAKKIGEAWYFSHDELTRLKELAKKSGSTVSNVFLTEKALKS